MRARRGAKILVAALAALAVSGGVAAAAPAGAAVMPMTSIVRACDYSVSPHTWRTGNARAVAFVHPATADAISIDVQLQTALPNTNYYVKVFQMPRGSADCGVAPIGVRTDAVGAVTATVTTPINADTTGVWVSVERPDPYSQLPTEVYTSDFIAEV
ncbi:hypothetical protein ACWDUN_13580 [Mycobacterium sp. NPDC003323]